MRRIDEEILILAIGKGSLTQCKQTQNLNIDTEYDLSSELKELHFLNSVQSPADLRIVPIVAVCFDGLWFVREGKK